MKANSAWTFEEALMEQGKYVAANPDKEIHPGGPLYQWFALKRLETYQEGFEKGDKFLLMLALKECAQHDLIIPDWVARAYLLGFYGVVNARIKTWDEAFGALYKKGANLKAIRKRRLLSVAIMNAINDILSCKPDTPIDSALFERVGRNFNIGKTLAADYYYSAKKQRNG